MGFLPGIEGATFLLMESPETIWELNDLNPWSSFSEHENEKGVGGCLITFLYSFGLEGIIR